MKRDPPKALVFTDLDGTLIDEKYLYKDTQRVVERLLEMNVPIIFCSSKTSAEIEYYRDELNITHPFSSENGAAVFIPKGYFNISFEYSRQTEKYNIVEWGTNYSKLREKLETIRLQTGFNILGFGDMSVKEIAKDTGLSLEQAALAKKREYDEPFRIVDGDKIFIISMLEKEGLTVAKGDRYYHLKGYHNKGRAVELLKELYSKSWGNICSFGVGNGPNDLELLKAVDKPFFVQKTQNISEIWGKLLEQVENL